MCNLYSVRSSQEELRRTFRVLPEWDRLGNWPGKTAVFPDHEAPVIRNAENGARDMVLMRWGMPGPVQFGEQAITNIRNPTGPHWRGWLQPESRCLVPVTSFSEPTATKPATWHWFARSPERPLFAFAGLWRPWTGQRGTKSNPVVGDHLLYGFLTTEPNALVEPIHAKAMPVVLTTDEEFELWLQGPAEEALKLQRPAPLGLLEIVARGEKMDPPDGSVTTPLQGALL
jgi:putative SOS response-associated peptidase YedK